MPINILLILNEMVIRLQKQLKFFGFAPGMPSVPTPIGLRCYYCDAPFSGDAHGIVFMKHESCRAAHKDCFVRAAVKSLLTEFFD